LHRNLRSSLLVAINGGKGRSPQAQDNLERICSRLCGAYPFARADLDGPYMDEGENAPLRAGVRGQSTRRRHTHAACPDRDWRDGALSETPDFSAYAFSRLFF